MPIKKDGSGKRWVEMDLVLPGTPEQVWDAMATGPGMAAWFTRGEVEPRVGGAFTLDFGNGVTTSGHVTAWQPPEVFGYVETAWEPGAPPIATEITITARDGGRCFVRMVHSLFTASDAWDDQVEGFEKGWPAFFEVLRAYLAHFAGQPSSSFMVVSPAGENALAAWQQLAQQFGVAGMDVGERSTSVSDVERWTGMVEHVHQDAEQRWVIVRLDSPSPGLALLGTKDTTGSQGDVEKRVGKGPASNVSVCRFYYGDNAAESSAASEARWRRWVAESYTPPGREQP